MKKIILAAIALSFLLFISPLWAKRVQPPLVPAVENEEYFIPAWRYYDGEIRVHDPVSKKFLWKMHVYNIRRNCEWVEDMCTMPIVTLILKGDILKVTNDEGDEYEVDLRIKKSKAIKGKLVIDPFERYSRDAYMPSYIEADRIYDNQYSTCEACDTTVERFTKLNKKMETRDAGR